VFLSYFTSLRNELGEPQAVYIDDLYEEKYPRTVDFYFDKGIAVGSEHIILFKPRSDIDEEFVKELGRTYVRTTLGTKGYLEP
jgi:hypothetical protein